MEWCRKDFWDGAENGVCSKNCGVYTSLLVNKSNRGDFWIRSIREWVAKKALSTERADVRIYTAELSILLRRRRCQSG